MTHPIISFTDFLDRAAKLPAADQTHVRELWRRGRCAEASAYVEERGNAPAGDPIAARVAAQQAVIAAARELVERADGPTGIVRIMQEVNSIRTALAELDRAP